jgi:predicted nucleic acid-binding Zn ribbon protein
MEQRHPITRCRVCNTEFEKTRVDRVACSNTCNVRLHRLRKKAERVEELTVIEQLKNIVTQLVIDIQNLKAQITQE